MDNAKHLTECLCCGSTNLRETLDLNEQPMANSFKKTQIEEELEVAYKSKDSIIAIDKELSNFWIPVNIQHRGDEIENLNEKIVIIDDEYADLEKANDDFDGDIETEDKMLKL